MSVNWKLKRSKVQRVSDCMYSNQRLKGVKSKEPVVGYIRAKLEIRSLRV
jgi:hypothetical protein